MISRRADLLALTLWLGLLAAAVPWHAAADIAPAESPPAGSVPQIGLRRDPIERARAAIESSRESLEVAVYKFDERSLDRALRRALERGVRVRILADRDEAKRERSRVPRLGERGAEVRLWKKGKLHAKFLIVDGERVLTGSYNWTESAQGENMELAVEFDQPAVARRMLELFEHAWAEAAPSQ